MEKPSNEPARLLGSEATVLRLLGLWCPQERGGHIVPTMLAAVTLTSVCFLPAGVVLKLCGDFPEEIEEMAHYCYIFIVCFGSIVKAVLFIVEGGTLREMVQLMYSMRTQYGADEGSENIRSCYQDNVDRMYRYFQVMALLPTLYWICSPLLFGAVTSAVLDEQDNQRQLPLPFWLPSGVNSSPTYQLLYVIQAFSLTVTVESAICLDVFFIRLMMMVAAELQVLNENISAIDCDEANGREDQEYDSLIPRGDRAPQFTEKYRENFSDDEIFSRLLKNILHHQTILRCIWLLQTAMNVSIFILLFVNMANLCFNMFVTAGLLQDGRNVTKAVTALSTVPGLLLQTAIYCLFGQITTDQSEKLSDSAYCCGWDECDTRFKRNLLIFMLMVGRPVEITVGKSCKLSKEMLLQVLNGTYVLLNMLFHVHSDD
ncbi:odorant receptor 43a-like [Schistocerca cancellata]|uniref:odorant receptor 43a-like n=1 Tax=Schistocerca cancellata TaxID=274614 RepID=UPI002119652A|nr:odorant receptor 43a-like [Schistocerca cancellata]